MEGDPTVGAAIYRQAELNVRNGKAVDVDAESRRIASMVSNQVSEIARQQRLADCTSGGSGMFWVGPLGAIAAMTVLLAEGADGHACLRSIPISPS